MRVVTASGEDWLEAEARRKAERKTKRTLETLEFLRKLKPGAILYQSWGYDQTNVDFFEVIDMRGCTVTLQEIGCKTVDGSQGRDCDYVVADPTVRLKAPFKKVVRSPWVSMTSYSSLAFWDGSKRYRSWYA